MSSVRLEYRSVGEHSRACSLEAQNEPKTQSKSQGKSQTKTRTKSKAKARTKRKSKTKSKTKTRTKSTTKTKDQDQIRSDLNLKKKTLPCLNQTGEGSSLHLNLGCSTFRCVTHPPLFVWGRGESAFFREWFRGPYRGLR